MTPLDSFMERLVQSASRDWNTEGPAFTLILGAGASRSAGVPVAAEMISILTTLAELKAIKIPRKPAREFLFSWTFRHVTERMPWEDEFFNYPRQFLMNCIKRANREPNLTHLVAAHLSSAHIIGDIVTTNFDDLALAAFWALPAVTAYVEPYVVYHPKTEPPPRSAGGVPVIIKAHGHHTIYGLDVIDRDIATTAPFVRKLLKSRPEPEIGFIVVGYSGGWADGVMATLSDRKITRGKTIYWFYTRQAPTGPHVERIKEASDVRFIRIADADQLFLEMWNELHVEHSELRVDGNEVHAVTRPSAMPILEEYHLFNSSRDFPIRRSLPDFFANGGASTASRRDRTSQIHASSSYARIFFPSSTQLIVGTTTSFCSTAPRRRSRTICAAQKSRSHGLSRLSSASSVSSCRPILSGQGAIANCSASRSRQRGLRPIP